MIKSSIDWNGGEAEKLVFSAGWDGLRRCVVYYWNAVQQALNKSNPGKYKKGRSVTYPKPSQPGEPPRKRTGFLQKNVLYEFDESVMAARVGIAENAIYGLYLELGTRNMAPRPWLLATLRKVMDQLRAIAAGGKAKKGTP